MNSTEWVVPFTEYEPEGWVKPTPTQIEYMRRLMLFYPEGNASEGDVRVFDGNVGLAQQAYASLSSCNDSALNSAISDRDAAESALSGDNDFPEKISLVNDVRTKRNELNIAIWGYRTHIGDSEVKVNTNDGFMNTVNTTKYKNLMNTGIE